LTPVTGLLLRRAPLFHYSSRSPIMTFLLLSSQPWSRSTFARPTRFMLFDFKVAVEVRVVRAGW